MRLSVISSHICGNKPDFGLSDESEVQGGAEVCGGVVDVGVVVQRRRVQVGRAFNLRSHMYNITPTTKLQLYESLVDKCKVLYQLSI
jgi:hypothetical protein